MYLTSLVLFSVLGSDPTAEEPKTRTFTFTYRAAVTGLAQEQTARIWLPVPSANEEQGVKIVAKEMPAKERLSREKKFGNRILYVEGKPADDGSVHVGVTYQIIRREVRGDSLQGARHLPAAAKYLRADRLVPIDGKPLELLKDVQLPENQMEAARVLYDVVNRHMRYSKVGPGWGRGDSAWACESGFGNCSDFHSLFISLARAEKIPAKFEIGFLLPKTPGTGAVAGYHCWAKFQPTGRGWIPVDISEASKDPKLRDYYFGNLSEDRVTFSAGRDLVLVPPQAGPPLNFFIYPYVEVGGKPYPDSKIKRQFSYNKVEPEEQP